MEPGDIIFVFLNSLLSILIVISNVFVLTVVIRTPKLHSPSIILLCNLALADLGVGLLTQPIFIISIIIDNPLKKLLDNCILVFGGVSLVGVMFVLLDRYYALSLHLRYQVVVTSQKAVIVVVGLWACSSVPLVIYFLRPSLIKFIGVLGGLSCFITSIVVYIKMFRIINRHRKQIMAQSVTSNYSQVPLRARSKSIKTSILVQFVFILSWLPLIVVAILKKAIENRLSREISICFFHLAVSVFLSKSLANPLLYCWRVKEIKQALFKASKKIGAICYH